MNDFFTQLSDEGVAVDAWLWVLLKDVQSSKATFSAMTRLPCGAVETQTSTGAPTGAFVLKMEYAQCGLAFSKLSGPVTFTGSSPTAAAPGSSRSQGTVAGDFTNDWKFASFSGDMGNRCSVTGSWVFDFIASDTSSDTSDVAGKLELSITCGAQTRSFCYSSQWGWTPAEPSC